MVFGLRPASHLIGQLCALPLCLLFAAPVANARNDFELLTNTTWTLLIYHRNINASKLVPAH